MVEAGGFRIVEDPGVLSTEDYSMALRPLRNNLAFFKEEINEAMTQNYFALRDADQFDERALVSHISPRIKRLRQAVAKFNAVVPEIEVKAGLGIHWDLHKDLSYLV
jgi:hypothetical protein